jgi:hypothetical protein
MLRDRLTCDVADRRLRVVYVSGSITAPTAWGVEQNVRKAEELALEVWKTRLLVPICVHTMGRFYDGELPHEAWLAGDLEVIRRCDAVLVVAGSEGSEGTRAEVAHAVSVGVPVFYSLGELVGWVRSTP